MANDLKPKSFVENVNTIANATTLATGDIIEDAQIAAEEAQASAEAAKSSENNAYDSEQLAHEWATKAYNNPVTGGEFSAYHWSVEAHNNSGEQVIDDNAVSLNTTWSSQLISDRDANKSDITHLHTGVYEPVITKATAFNKNFGSSGTSVDVSRADHEHDATYEHVIGAKGTAFNKNFGTNSGEVSEGDHTHNYMPLVTVNTAYNKNFPVDSNNPQSTEVARASHTHNDSNISHDATSNIIVTSSTVKGAIDQIDAELSIFEVGERSTIVAGMTNASQLVTITTPGVGVQLITAMTSGAGSKNATYSGGAVVIDYLEDPSKLIEGWFSATVTINVEPNIEYAMGIWVNGVLSDPSFKTELGSASKDTEGTFAFSIDGFTTGLSNGDTLSIGLYNGTNADDITVLSHTISWAGAPEGALIASGITVDHNDITGRDAINQHPFESIYSSGSGNNLEVELATKTDKIIPSLAGNIATLDATGNLLDSGVPGTAVDDHMSKIATPTLDNIVAMTSGGDSKDTGTKIADLALVGGNSAQVFEVATATLDTHAITKATFDSTVGQLATDQDLTDHIALPNPHMTTYTDVGAAPTVHTHVIGDTTGLQDALDDKYAKVTAPATDNIVLFETGGLLKDSGKSLDEIVGTPVATGYAGHTLSTRAATAKDSEWSPFVTSPNDITVDYVMQTGVNASIVSPTIADGITVEIPDGSSLVIL